MRIKLTVAECLVGDRSWPVSKVTHGDATVRFGEHGHRFRDTHGGTGCGSDHSM